MRYIKDTLEFGFNSDTEMIGGRSAHKCSAECEEFYTAEHLGQGWTGLSHKAVILRSDIFGEVRHRCYSNIDLKHHSGENWRSMCASLDICVHDFMMDPGEWLSLATFVLDDTDDARRVLTFNLDQDLRPHFGHVPFHGRQEPVFNNQNQTFPVGMWTRVDIAIQHITHNSGIAAVWVGGLLIQTAEFEGSAGFISRCHFGLYANGEQSRGVVLNDNLTLYRLED
jgi:hypothetical protein